MIMPTIIRTPRYPGHGAYGMTFDSSHFKKYLHFRAHKVFPQSVELGLRKATYKFMNDCIFEAPTAPEDTGALRASGSAFAQNKLVATTENYPHEEFATPMKIHFEPLPKHIFVGVVIFNRDYAWRWHEEEPPQPWRGRTTPFWNPTAGIGWMANKLLAFGPAYMMIIGHEIQRAMR